MQESGNPIQIQLFDILRQESELAYDQILVSKQVDYGIEDNLNLEFTSVSFSNLDGTGITVSVKQVGAPDTDEGENTNLIPGIESSGFLGYGSEGVDLQDVWNFSIPKNHYAQFELYSELETTISLVLKQGFTRNFQVKLYDVLQNPIFKFSEDLFRHSCHIRTFGSFGRIQNNNVVC